MFRSSLLQVVNFRSGGKSDIRKRGERRRMFLKSTYSFFFSFLSFSFFYDQVMELAKKLFQLLTRGQTLLLDWSLYLCASLGLFCPHWLGSQKTRVFISPHRLQTRHFKSFSFWRDRFPLATLIFIIFLFFWFLTGWVRGADAWWRVYTFCMWQPTSQHPVGSFIVNS